MPNKIQTNQSSLLPSLLSIERNITSNAIVQIHVKLNQLETDKPNESIIKNIVYQLTFLKLATKITVNYQTGPTEIARRLFAVYQQEQEEEKKKIASGQSSGNNNNKKEKSIPDFKFLLKIVACNWYHRSFWL